MKMNKLVPRTVLDTLAESAFSAIEKEKLIINFNRSFGGRHFDIKPLRGAMTLSGRGEFAILNNKVYHELSVMHCVDFDQMSPELIEQMKLDWWSQVRIEKRQLQKPPSTNFGLWGNLKIYLSKLINSL